MELTWWLTNTSRWNKNRSEDNVPKYVIRTKYDINTNSPQIHNISHYGLWPAFTRCIGKELTDLPLFFFYFTVCLEITCPPYANCVRSDSGVACVCPNCTSKGSKVCGSDGRTYKHSCELEKHACKKNKSISILSQGGCAGMLDTIRVNNISIQLPSRQRHTDSPPQPAKPWPEKVTLKTHKRLQPNSWT